MGIMGTTQSIVANDSGEKIHVEISHTSKEYGPKVKIVLSGEAVRFYPPRGRVRVQVYKEKDGKKADHIVSCEGNARSYFILEKTKGEFFISIGPAFLGKMPKKWKDYLSQN